MAFKLASTFAPPIPGKLVSKIQDLQFIDMRELLRDNIALLRHKEGLNSLTAHPPLVISSHLL